ncbi:LysR family transcriptional regulator [Kinneretia aquatilis]|uniref:LysR family transcriptional regulator n=1 Tax=Kinneretia aquatilis TaxID=2070761 RepID=UPI001CBEEF5D|nr:LysR family transcriptional regulator [Paucibacter aquatile]WIV97814.1 LysR family transcriptional regulator [Paucibacter aquatile]
MDSPRLMQSFPRETELQTLRVFAAVAEARSYRRAAQQLGLSPSAVSQAMRRLEAQLGVALLNRSTRSVALTAAGERLLAGALPAMRSLERALDSVVQLSGRVSGSLRLSVPRSAARLLMTSLLARYVAAHPQVQVELCTQDGLVDIVEQGFDAGVRFAERLPADMVAVPLGGAQRFIAVASPEFSQRHPAPQQPQDLLALPCVRQRFASGGLFRWSFLEHAAGCRCAGSACARAGLTTDLDVPGPLTVDDQAVALQAALDGAGVAYVYELAAAPLLHSGQLIELLADWCPPGTGFALYYPGRLQTSPALRALIELIQALPLARLAPLKPAST